MHNKKVLSKIDLGSYIQPNPYKNDIIYDPRGQWEHPGQNTRIPGGDITMDNVPYPVWAQPNVGPGTMMQPEQDYNFPGADYVDEYPELKRGGNKVNNHLVVKQSKIAGADKGLFANALFKKNQLIGLAHRNNQPVEGIGKMHNHSDEPNMYSVKKGNERYVYAKRDIKPGEELTTNYRLQPELEQPEDFKKGGTKKKSGKYTRNIFATNKLFVEGPLFKKAKKYQIFDPNASFYQDGGSISFDYDDTFSTDEGLEMAKYKTGSDVYIVSARPYVTEDMVQRAKEAGIPQNRIFATGSDEAKLAKIKELGIGTHVDNKKSVIKKLGSKGRLFQEGGGTSVECTDDGRCYETDQAQELLDKTHRTVSNAITLDRNVLDATSHGYPANEVWQEYGVKTADQLTGDPNAFSCANSATRGYAACDPNVKDIATLSNERMKNAVAKGNTPFRKVGTYGGNDFKDVVRPGNLVSFMGNNFHHMVKNIGPNEYAQSMGDVQDWNNNQGVNWVPNYAKATVYEYAPYYDQIQALEEQARTNPTRSIDPEEAVQSLPIRPAQVIESPAPEREIVDNRTIAAAQPRRLKGKTGGALLTKKVTCKNCGWKWDAADGGDDVTTCHKCGGEGLVHAQFGLFNNWKNKNVDQVIQNGEPQEGVQQIPEMQAYGSEAKKKLHKSLLDKANALWDTVEGRKVWSQQGPKNYSIEELKKFVGNVKDFNNEAQRYERDRRMLQNGELSTDVFAQRFRDGNWARFDENTGRENYKGEYKNAVNEANKRKEKNMAVTDAVLELTGAPSLSRIASDPVGTLKGVGQTVADVASLPVGLSVGAYNYATDGNFDMGKNIIGQNYGEGLNETLDVAAILPGISGARSLVNPLVKSTVKGIGNEVRIATQGMGDDVVKAVKPNGILPEYKNIEELRLANNSKNFEQANKTFPEIFPTKEVFNQTKSQAKKLLKDYGPEFNKKFGTGSDEEILLYGAHDDLGKLNTEQTFLADDKFAQSAGLNKDLSPQEKFLGDAYQLEFSGHFNKKPQGNTKFADYLSEQFEPVITKNQVNRPVQVSRVSNFDRPVKTIRSGATDPEMIHYNDLMEGDVIYPEHNWSTTANVQGDVWGSGTGKSARINLPEGQSTFRPNMYKGSQYANEEELVLPSKLGYKVSGVNPQGVGNNDPRFIFDVVDSYKKGGASNNYIELDLTPEEIEQYRKGGYIVEDISVPSLNRMQDGNEVNAVTAPQGSSYDWGQQQQIINPGNVTPVQQIAPVAPVQEIAPEVIPAPTPVVAPVVEPKQKSVTNDPIPVKNSVMELQKKLKAAGYDLGNYGPNKDGIDGQMGNRTKLAQDAFEAGIPPKEVKVPDPKQKVKGQTNNYTVNTNLKDGYLPYLGIKEEYCTKDKGCSANVSIKMGNLLGGITDESLWANDAWFNKSEVINKGGDLIYENNERDVNKMQKVPRDVYSKLQVGDYVQLNRADSASSERFAAQTKAGLTNEGIEHLGFIVGKDKDGTPLVWHGSEKGKAFIQRIDQPIVLNDHDKNKFTYQVSSIVRSSALKDADFSGLQNSPYYTALDPKKKLVPKEGATPTQIVAVDALNKSVNSFKNLGYSQDDANYVGRILIGGIMTRETTGNTSYKTPIKQMAAYLIKDVAGIDAFDIPGTDLRFPGKEFKGDEASIGIYQMKPNLNFKEKDGSLNPLGKKLQKLGVDVNDIGSSYEAQTKAGTLILLHNYEQLKKDPDFNVKTGLYKGKIPASYILAKSWQAGQGWYKRDKYKKFLDEFDIDYSNDALKEAVNTIDSPYASRSMTKEYEQVTKYQQEYRAAALKDQEAKRKANLIKEQAEKAKRMAEEQKKNPNAAYSKRVPTESTSTYNPYKDSNAIKPFSMSDYTKKSTKPSIDFTVYRYPGKPGVTYRKDSSGNWYINSGKSTGNKYVSIKDPSGDRARALSKNAIKAKEGGIVTSLTQAEINEYIKNGYVVEQVD